MVYCSLRLECYGSLVDHVYVALDSLLPYKSEVAACTARKLMPAWHASERLPVRSSKRAATSSRFHTKRIIHHTRPLRIFA